MKKNSIKSHLRPYSIFQKRKTTINHAFASALAPNDEFDEQTIDEALVLLGQNPDVDLICVYCHKTANTWDHLVSLVKDSQLRGYGHQIGNLVPCCSECNSKKGAMDWQSFLITEIIDEEYRKQCNARLASYLNRFAEPIDLENIKKERPNEWARYFALKEQIFELMKEADLIAAKLRAAASGVFNMNDRR